MLTARSKKPQEITVFLTDGLIADHRVVEEKRMPYKATEM